VEHSHRRAGFSHRLDLALAAATRAHHGAFRKGTDVPYAMHPFHVAFILERHGLPEDVVIAGLLHDVLEDSDVYSEDDLRSEFGEEVLRLVKAVTELRRQGGVRPPWEERKEEQLERLRGARVDEVSLKAADAIHNVRSLITDLDRDGIETLDRFTKGAAEVLWYYKTIATIVQDGLGESSPLSNEVRAAVESLEKKFEALD